MALCITVGSVGLGGDVLADTQDGAPDDQGTGGTGPDEDVLRSIMAVLSVSDRYISWDKTTQTYTVSLDSTIRREVSIPDFWGNVVIEMDDDCTLYGLVMNGSDDTKLTIIGGTITNVPGKPAIRTGSNGSITLVGVTVIGGSGTAEKPEGAPGITSDVPVVLTGGTVVMGGNGHNSGTPGVPGGNGAPAVTGSGAITLNDSTLVGGNGGDGFSSVGKAPTVGGNGGAPIGSTTRISGSGELVGGNGGTGGSSPLYAGGNGGDGAGFGPILGMVCTPGAGGNGGDGMSGGSGGSGGVCGDITGAPGAAGSETSGHMLAINVTGKYSTCSVSVNGQTADVSDEKVAVFSRIEPGTYPVTLTLTLDAAPTTSTTLTTFVDEDDFDGTPVEIEIPSVLMEFTIIGAIVDTVGLSSTVKEVRQDITALWFSAEQLDEPQASELIGKATDSELMLFYSFGIRVMTNNLLFFEVTELDTPMRITIELTPSFLAAGDADDIVVWYEHDGRVEEMPRTDGTGTGFSVVNSGGPTYLNMWVDRFSTFGIGYAVEPVPEPDPWLPYYPDDDPYIPPVIIVEPSDEGDDAVKVAAVAAAAVVAAILAAFIMMDTRRK